MQTVNKSQAAGSLITSSQSRKSTRHKVQHWPNQLVTENWLWRVDRVTSWPLPMKWSSDGEEVTLASNAFHDRAAVTRKVWSVSEDRHMAGTTISVLEAECSLWREWIFDTSLKSSEKYSGPRPWRQRYTSMQSLKFTRSVTDSQWSCCSNGIMLHSCLSETKQPVTTLVMWVNMWTCTVRPLSIHTPRSRTTDDGPTELSQMRNGWLGSWLTRCELHHRISVLAAFSCSRLTSVHLAISSTQVDSWPWRPSDLFVVNRSCILECHQHINGYTARAWWQDW